MKKQILFVVLLIITVVLAAMSWHYFGSDDSGILRNKPDEVKSWLPFVLRVHIGGGMLALATGALLVLSSKGPGLAIHRWAGRFYTVFVFTSGLAGVVIAPHAIGGAVSALGLGSLAFGWMYTTGLAVRAALNGNWPAHRRYTTYSLALTFSSLTFRLVLLLAFLGFPFITVYQTSCWVSWLLHIGLANWWLSYQPSSTHQLTNTTTA